jgi:hypothetical protein
MVVWLSVPTSVSGAHHVALTEGHLREVLQVHLVADAHVRGHHAEALERVLAPAQERVALLVALELELGVGAEGVRGAEHVHLERVVDDQVGRVARVDLRRVTAHGGERLAHGGEVHHRGHAGEVLQQHARRVEGDFGVRIRLGVPGEHLLDVLALHHAAVLVAQQVLEQDLQREGEAGDRGVVLAHLGEAVEVVRGRADLELALALETVRHVSAVLPSVREDHPLRIGNLESRVF